MKKTLSFILILFCAAMAASCGSRTVGADVIDRAEHAIIQGDHTAAQRCADSLVLAENDMLSSLSPSQLCRLALVYKKLADNTITNEDVNTATALRIYKMAFTLSADSVIIFRRSLTLDDAAAFEVLSSLNDVAEKPVDLNAAEPVDSIGSETEIYEEAVFINEAEIIH